MSDELASLAEVFGHHLGATEGPGGLFEEVPARSPRLGHMVERLRSDHSGIGIDLEQGEIERAFLQDVADQNARRLGLPAYGGKEANRGMSRVQA